MIYMIRIGSVGPVKIGVAKNPLWRVKELQTAHPERLVLLDQFDAPDKEERFLHERLKAHRLVGEWFKPEPEVFGVWRSSKVCALLGPIYDDNVCPECNMSVAYGWWTTEHTAG